ncbi:MAG TPA: hypothetical protein VJX67_08835 [Blastocatellia bacterium]|nr:hypothetical protein [Blastocatellia bacterium]
MESVSIQRSGSLIYARAYKRLVLWIELAYVLLGAGLAILATSVLNTWIAGVVVFGLVLVAVALIWLSYQALLWVLKREARRTVEVSGLGIKETAQGRELAFIPWNGVTQIELDATLIGGASLRVKGSFCEIAISNQDLVITRPMKIREMNAALGQLGSVRNLLTAVREEAPQAAVRMNRLAVRRYKESGV